MLEEGLGIQTSQSSSTSETETNKQKKQTYNPICAMKKLEDRDREGAIEWLLRMRNSKGMEWSKRVRHSSNRNEA